MSSQLVVKTPELQRTLVRHLRARTSPPMVFEEIALEGSWGSAGRLDVVSLTTARAYSVTRIDGYELKVSRGDLCSDLEAEKWRKYLTHLDRFFFVVPAGLSSKAEIPGPAGLMVMSADGRLSTVRRAGRLDPPRPPAADVLLRLLWRSDAMCRGLELETGERRRRTRIEDYAAMSDDELGSFVKGRFAEVIRSASVAKQVQDRRERDLERQREQYEELIQRAEGLPELLKAVGEILRATQQAVDGWTPDGRVQARERLLALATALSPAVGAA